MNKGTDRTNGTDGVARRLWRRLRWNRVTLWLEIVWRPVTRDEGDTWWQAWRKYRLDAGTAWRVAGTIHRIATERRGR